jgi:hypothetical protein
MGVYLSNKKKTHQLRWVFFKKINVYY